MKNYDRVLLVSGGAGFIGSAFLRMLVPKYPNWFFINLDALTYAGELKKVDSVQDYENYFFVHGNICDRPLVERLFEQHNVNIVVNFAAESHVDNSIKDAESFVETNIRGAYILMDVAKNKWNYNGKKNSNEIYRFIQISTDEVYGSLGINDESFKEDSKIAPNSPYSASKAAAEHIAMSYHKTYFLPIIITRSSNNFGMYQNSEKFIPTVIKSVILNDHIPIYGNGKNIRDWIYVDDNVEAIELIINKGVIGNVYNIGGDCELTNIELALKILKLVPNSSSEIKYVDDRLGHDFRYSINSSALKEMGYIKKSDFDMNLEKTISFIRENINEFYNK